MNRRLISFIIAMAILLPLFSHNSYGNNYVKEIDGIFNGMEIYIEGKKMKNHEEPFVYEDIIWISLKDLTKGLDLDYKLDINKKTVKLNSSGKLNVDGVNSKKILAYQRGYEIQAKERIIYDLEGKKPSSIKKNQTEIKNIKVGFGNWSIYLDNNRLDISESLIYYNDNIYINIYDIAPYLYITPNYREDRNILDIKANGILIDHSYFSSLDNMLAVRQGENRVLDAQMEILMKRKSMMESLRGIPYGNLKNMKDLEKYLNKHFNTIGELSVDIKVLQGGINLIYLDISFPRSNTYRWYKLQRKEVEDWIWDMYIAILELYNENAIIKGNIANPNYYRYSKSSYKDFVTFETKNKDLYFDFSKSLLKKDYRFNPSYLLDLLSKSLKKYNNIGFKYQLDSSGEDIDLIVYPDSNIVKDWSIFSKMAYLKRLNYEIRRTYPDLIVDGKFIFPKEDIEPIKFNFNENRIKSYALLRDTEKYFNSNYGSFTHGRYSYGLDFKLYEKDDESLTLIVEGDFSVGDDSWVNVGDVVAKRINTRVQNAISTTISLWNMNVFTEVVDKNGVTITELDIYRKNVGIVYATPEEGEIKEGTPIYLYTDTPGAEIYYTLDGSTPNRQSNQYTQPIVVSRDITINAFGYKEGMGAGPISSFKYTVRD